MRHENSMCECLACGEMTAQEDHDLPFVGKLRGEVIEYSASGFYCSSCSFQWSTAEQEGSHDRAKAEVYRICRGMVTAQQLEEARENYRMDKKEFAEEFLEVSRMNYDRWLAGLVQNKVTDNHLRMKIDQRSALKNYLELCWLDFRRYSTEFLGGSLPSLDKVLAVIIEFLKRKQDSQKLGALYLNKLLWYADQLHYNRYRVSITGTPYLRLEHGPVVDRYREVLRLLCEDGIIEEIEKNSFVVRWRGSISELAESELEVVNEVWNKLCSRLSQVRNLSHDEEGWLKTSHRNAISYDLSTTLKALE